MTTSETHALTNRHVGVTFGAESLPEAGGCFDYLGVTLPDSIPLKDAMVLVSGTSGWEMQEHGTAGYQNSARWGEWVCSWGGTRGIHFEGAGKACRQLEERKGHDWLLWVQSILESGGSFSRSDVAWDLTSGVVSLRDVVRSVDERHVVTKARYRKVIHSWYEDGSDRKGATVYVGSGRSAMSARIYDKAAQMHLPGSWVRVELQCRHWAAQRTMREWAAAAQKERDRVAGGGKWSGVRHPEGSALGGVSEARTVAGAAVAATDGLAAGFQCVAGFLKGWASFREVPQGSNDTQVWRWPEASWWARLMRGVEACAAVMNKAPRSLDQLIDWVEHAVGPSLAVYLAAHDGDLDCLTRLAGQGRGRWVKRHRSMLVAAGIDP